ncbi:hypothetical protein [Sandaracinus amylolyticus]|uniref:hypothetical protein n=1 Tax=Sandaracinus amylolyticus TaxID=927083 RepID=UPI001F31EBEB|nr:hypothetical protein [Sandaracinus amylolyticus]UJR84626.1 Hypothetical protein I5071_67050 [Sandaracinus amylolyticus]
MDGSRISKSAALFAMIFAAMPERAAAQYEEYDTMAPRIYALGQVAFIGDLHVQVEDGDEATDGMQVSGGGALGFELPVVELFSIGGEISALVWNNDDAADQEIGPNVLGELSVVPRFRIPWASSSRGGAHGAFTLGGVFGLTLNFPNEEWSDAVGALGGDLDIGVGAHAGGLVGAQFFFTHSFGVIVEGGYVHHFAWHRLSFPVIGERELALDFGQITIRAGLALAF